MNKYLLLWVSFTVLSYAETSWMIRADQYFCALSSVRLIVADNKKPSAFRLHSYKMQAALVCMFFTSDFIFLGLDLMHIRNRAQFSDGLTAQTSPLLSTSGFPGLLECWRSVYWAVFALLYKKKLTSPLTNHRSVVLFIWHINNGSVNRASAVQQNEQCSTACWIGRTNHQSNHCALIRKLVPCVLMIISVPKHILQAFLMVWVLMQWGGWWLLWVKISKEWRSNGDIQR